VLDAFSAHADQQDLVDFAEAVRERGALEQIALVHGEPAPQRALTVRLEERGFTRIACPDAGERLAV
jgi:metallo-beta-lactamase family protein